MLRKEEEGGSAWSVVSTAARSFQEYQATDMSNWIQGQQCCLLDNTLEEISVGGSQTGVGAKLNEDVEMDVVIHSFKGFGYNGEEKHQV